MKLHRLHAEQEVAAPIDKVFGFFSQPENLEKLTPPAMKMVTLTPKPVSMHQGAMIDYLVTVNALPMRWTANIVDYDPPRRFVDLQLRGPYSYWHHTHSFEDRGESTLSYSQSH